MTQKKKLAPVIAAVFCLDFSFHVFVFCVETAHSSILMRMRKEKNTLERRA